MTSLLRLPEDELTRRSSAVDGLRLAAAVTLAAFATVMALVGLAARFGPPGMLTIPGISHPAGLAAWAVVLGGAILLAGVLAESVVVRRLQKAVLISLIIHLLLCLLSLLVHLRGLPVAQVEAELDGAAEVAEFSVPDYGGMESSAADAQAFNAPAQVELSARRSAELERQIASVEATSAPQDVPVEQTLDVTPAASVSRPAEQVMPREMQMELERQQRQETGSPPQTASQPDVSTESVQQPTLAARSAERTAADLAEARREVSEVFSPSQALSEATAIDIERAAARSASSMADGGAAASGRSAAEAAPTATAAQMAAVATAAAPMPEVEQQRSVLERQTAADAAASSAVTESPNVEQTLQAAQVTVQRSTTSTARTSIVIPDSVPTAQRPARSTATPSSDAATTTVSETIQVATAQPAATADVNFRENTTAVARSAVGTQAPAGAAAAAVPSPAVATAAGAAQTPAGGTIARNGTTSAVPELSDVPGAGAVRGSARSSMNRGAASGAVGTQAEAVDVRTAAAAGGRGTLLVAGPSGGSTGVGRNRAALPAGGSVSGGRADAAGTGRLAGQTGTLTTGGASGRLDGRGIQALGTSGLAGRGAGPSATLGEAAGTAADVTGITGTGRSRSGVELPAGMLAAEQAGALVMAGPQAGGTRGGSQASGGLAGVQGPRTTSIGRRSAALPGRASGSSLPRTVSGLPRTASAGRIAIGSASGGTGPRPVVAAASEIAGLMRRTAPSAAVAGTQASSAGFSMRRADVRREAAETLGGNRESEDAVERGLNWLARHQYAAGNWSIHQFECGDECPGHGSFESDTAATGLALLAFLGAGYTHTSGEHQDVVRRGLHWLTSHQKSDGDLFVDETEFVWLYSHGMAAIALCEAYGMTGDESLRRPAQQALDFIVAAQHPEFGGWRYRPRFESDTSVSGWQLMALKSGEMAGLSVPDSAYEGVTRWLNSAESGTGRYRYHPSREISLAMTAEGLLMRQYLGARRDNPRLIAGANYLRSRLPRLAERDAYYWYYATQVMFHMQGDYWSEWNARLRDLLVDGQLKDGHAEGSWNPAHPVPARWGAAGGRHYLTCLNLLMLEVYYRHLPLYIELDR